MNNLLESILGAQGGGAIDQIAQQFGLQPDQVKAVVGQLAPTLGRGIQENTRSSGGLEALTKALQNGNHQRYVDDPAELGSARATEDGNGILGHILGSKDVSRQLAGRASEQTGVESGLIKKILPIVASLAMGGLAKESNQGAGQSGNQLSDMLGSFLDADGDGSAMDDLIGMAGKFLGR